MSGKTPITVAHGSGIGPAITKAALRAPEASAAQIEMGTIEIGGKVSLSGNMAATAASSWGSVRRTKVFLKGITTPRRGGFKSLNVTSSKTRGLSAGIDYQLSANGFHSIQLISRTNTEKIVRYAFEYARQHNRKKVTCFTKDHIMQMSDGLSLRSSTRWRRTTLRSRTSIGSSSSGRPEWPALRKPPMSS